MPALPVAERPQTLSPEERGILAKRRFSPKDRAAVAHLLDPFEISLRAWTLQGLTPSAITDKTVQCTVHFYTRLMVALDCPYWALDWDRLQTWRTGELAQAAGQKASWVETWHKKWRRVTSTLFYLGVVPYHEAIFQTGHRRLAGKWLGRDTAQEIEARFLAAAKGIGYWDARNLRKAEIGALFATLMLTGKTDPLALTKAELEDWQARTGRSPRVARESVTCIQRVLAALGGLGEETPRRSGAGPRHYFTWQRTAPAIVATFQRFLADMATVREPGTVASYRCALRRFGDWLGEQFPDILSIAALHRRHIEAFKSAVLGMRCGDYTGARDGSGPPCMHMGRPLARQSRNSTLVKVRSFFQHIDALEYPERPGRTLWVRGDILQRDQELPRPIPEADWRRLTDLAERLTSELVKEHRFPAPFERLQALFAILFECALRAGELCRLDTSCLLAARDTQTGQETYWLRVPVGKGHDDRMVPIRPGVVAAVDAWMRVRGPQPLGQDRRTNKARDFLFTWQGRPLSGYTLNAYIERLCSVAETTERYTSHRFRHTLATLWRQRGMRLESIRQMLGHKKLDMTLRYAAVMPPQLRREFEEAFAAIDEEYRATAQVRVLLSPAAHLEAQQQWRESLFVDLGIGWCGLTAYHPCETRLACHTCPNFLPDRERLPLLEQQRANLIELRGLVQRVPGSRRQDAEQELTSAIGGLDGTIAAVRNREAAQGEQEA
jgi:integrase